MCRSFHNETNIFNSLFFTSRTLVHSTLCKRAIVMIISLLLFVQDTIDNIYAQETFIRDIIIMIIINNNNLFIYSPNIQYSSVNFAYNKNIQ